VGIDASTSGRSAEECDELLAEGFGRDHRPEATADVDRAARLDRLGQTCLGR